MERQLNLFGSPAREIVSTTRNGREREEGPWTHVCTFACWHALEEKCVCRCGGRFHGRALAIRGEGQGRLGLDESGEISTWYRLLQKPRVSGKGAALDLEVAERSASIQRGRAPGIRIHPRYEDEELEAPGRIGRAPGRVGR